MDWGFGCGQEDEIRATELAASEQDARDLEYYADGRDGSDPEPNQESDAQYYERMDREWSAAHLAQAQDADYDYDYEANNNIASSENAQLDAEYFANYEYENCLWPSNRTDPTYWPYPPISPKIVALPDGIDLTAPTVRSEEHRHEQVLVSTRSFIGMAQVNDGTVKYADSIETTLTREESLREQLARACANPISFARSVVQGESAVRGSGDVTTAAIGKRLYDQHGFPEPSESPVETYGYEMVCYSTRYDPAGVRLFCVPGGLLIFPETRELAEVLHRTAVSHLVQGATDVEAIKLVQAQARNLGVQTLAHGFYGPPSDSNSEVDGVSSAQRKVLEHLQRTHPLQDDNPTTSAQPLGIKGLLKWMERRRS